MGSLAGFLYLLYHHNAVALLVNLIMSLGLNCESFLDVLF